MTCLVQIISLLCVVTGSGLALGAGFDQHHLKWTTFLKQNVITKGQTVSVKYNAAKNDPAILNSYVVSIESVKKKDFDDFSENDRLAFLINAYNALTVKLIVDHYPVKSIKDIGSVLKSPWKQKFFTFLGEVHSLDDIEHEMIRKSFPEPRIHFALVCASKGCPALRNEAYEGNTLNAQLDSAAKTFLLDPSKNRYLIDTNRLEISSIFKWYGDDFAKKFGSVEEYLATRITTDLKSQQTIRNKKALITYLDYDWSLNEEK